MQARLRLEITARVHLRCPFHPVPLMSLDVLVHKIEGERFAIDRDEFEDIRVLASRRGAVGSREVDDPPAPGPQDSRNIIVEPLRLGASL